MRLSEFIVQNVDRIVDEWEQFAQTITPAAHAMVSAAKPARDKGGRDQAGRLDRG